MAVSAERLKQVALFSELSNKQRRNIAGMMRERTFAPGEKVTVEGEAGVGFFVIASGDAEVSVDGQVKSTLHAGDHFGEVALLGHSARTATVVATTELQCYGMTSWQFRPLVEGDAAIAWKLLQGLAALIASR
jgi:CRP-like cAMP-binding protein